MAATQSGILVAPPSLQTVPAPHILVWFNVEPNFRLLHSTTPTWKNSYYRSSIMLKAFCFGEETSQDLFVEVEWLSTASLPCTGFPGHPWPHHHRGWNNPGPAASLPRVDVVCHLSEDHKTHKLGHLAISKLHRNWYLFFEKESHLPSKNKTGPSFSMCTSEALTSVPKQTPTFPKKESNLMWPSWKGSQNDTHGKTSKLGKVKIKRFR